MGDIVPPHSATEFAPRYVGRRPAYGWYMRNVNGVSLRNVDVKWRRDDGRPAALVEGQCNGVHLDTFKAARAADAVDYDVGLRNGCSGVHVTNSPGIITKHLPELIAI